MVCSSAVLENPEPNGHFVQLYGPESSVLCHNVSRYLSEGLKRGEAALVIASPEHTRAFLCDMETAGVDTQQALGDSRLLLLDAERTLGEFLIDGQPHWGRFEIAMREAMSKVQMSAPSGLRAYGEMVGILWTAGDYTAAIRLEEFWNKLLHDGGFSLFCSYPIDIFASDFRVSGVDALLCDHTHLIPSGADEALENAINRAIDERLGGRAHDVRTRMKTNHRSSWALLPTGESMILWLRKNLPREADSIVSLAGRYYRTAAGF